MSEPDRFCEPPPAVFRSVTDSQQNDWMATTVRVPLLSAAEEVELANRRDVGTYARWLLDAGDDRFDVGTLERLVHEGELAVEWLVVSNLRLVYKLARSYHRSALPMLDIIQFGCMGLAHAVDKFDQSLGFKMSTYVTAWIKQTIVRGIADTGYLIRTPAHFHDLVWGVDRARRQEAMTWDEVLVENPGGLPGNGLSREQLLTAWMVRADMESVESLRDGDDGWELRAWGWCSNVDDMLAEWAVRSEVDMLLARLPEQRMVEVLMMRHGLGVPEPMRLEDVGQVYGITREGARQVQVKAMKLLRASL